MTQDAWALQKISGLDAPFFLEWKRRSAAMGERTIWYQVADLNNPAAEPFMVVRIDTSMRSGSGVEGTVESLHWNRDEAEARANELTEEYIASVLRRAVGGLSKP